MLLGNVYKRPMFYFSQVQFDDKTYGLKITGNPDDEMGLIDTGFDGYLIFPSNYAAIITSTNFKERKFTLANNSKISGLKVIARIAFFDDEYVKRNVVFAKVNGVIMGTQLLKELQKVTFDFKKEKVTF